MIDWIKKHGALASTLAVCVILGSIVASMLFSKPDHITGLVVEKIYVPPKSVTGSAPYGGLPRRGVSITVERQEQWIAIVATDQGDTLAVHCHPDHYGMKNVGDRIHFKEYEGSYLHIKYFAHNEEEK